MNDALLKIFLSECREIAGGFERLNSKHLKNHKDAFCTRYVVKDEPDYCLYQYQSAYCKKKKGRDKNKTVLIIYSLINRATIVDLQRKNLWWETYLIRAAKYFFWIGKNLEEEQKFIIIRLFFPVY